MNKHPLNISIVDDDKIYQFTAKKIVESIGITNTIQPFYNGEEAINFLRENIDKSELIPDIIFLDINMPIKGGWNFLEDFIEIQNKLPKKITIYMVSSSVDDCDIKKAKEFSMVAEYIIKPVNKERFEQLIVQTANQ